ncbi:substrate-binding domain-containing protein [Ramlibacter sp.]|uniref:molybdate ABC transporter substrate-binding protein n=1 Tax=Ramlibacter sp. TaxID=1917967 RepID=UPI002634CAB3|nr:substrate-binding domain-containing protein [Ramlibacter sp.]MDB5954672.1 molybdate transport system substrate-binding protein [Ramlibacter sp.]
MTNLRNALFVFATSIAALGPIGAAAQQPVQVIISGGFSGPYERLVRAFEQASGVKVVTGSGASQGSGPQTIAAQLQRGVPADVVILSREGLQNLIAAGRIARGSDVDLARTPLGVAVRAGAAKPAVATVDEFKALMLRAHGVAVPSSTSGIFLAKDVFPRLGLADKVPLQATPRGAEAAALVAEGKAEIAVMPVSEIVHAPGVELAGVIAPEIQLNQVFAAAQTSTSTQPEAARKLIAFLASPEAAADIANGGMEPLGRRP